MTQDNQKTDPSSKGRGRRRSHTGRTPEELEYLATQLFWLHDLMVQMSAAEDARDVRRRAVQCTARILEQDWCGLLGCTEHGVKASAFEGEGRPGWGKSLKTPSRALLRVLERDSEAVCIKDEEALADLAKIWPNQATEEVCLAPVWCSHHVSCLLATGSHVHPPHAEMSLMLMNAIAASVAVALDKATLYERVRRLAITDGLTQTANYRLFREVLDRLVNKAHRGHAPFSLLMADVDSFKAYNDLNGHPAGDKALVQMAQIMRRCLERSDTLARCGGEEFAVLLPGKGIDDAMDVGTRLIQAVAETAFHGQEHLPTGRLTISVGVASCPDHAHTPDDLVQRADQALYVAKWSGKNTVKRWDLVERTKADE